MLNPVKKTFNLRVLITQLQAKFMNSDSSSSKVLVSRLYPALQHFDNATDRAFLHNKDKDRNIFNFFIFIFFHLVNMITMKRPSLAGFIQVSRK